ncbi:MAG: CPBP family glutamic-type intramembrane protease [Firmicutes bacterium]|nr:CPBP family glutamic-type intramembrane protease [Bacillota bacterium]
MNKLTLATNANFFMVFLLAFNVFLSFLLGTLGVYQIFPWSLLVSQFFGLILPLFLFRTMLPHVPPTPKNLLHAKQVLLIFAFSIFVQPALMVVSAISGLFLQNPVPALVSDLSNLNFALALAIVAVVPSICEELVFRGFIQTGYKFQPVAKAAFVNGLFFGFIHLNLHQFTYAFIMGIIFFYLVHITKSIFSAILSHFVINATQFTLGFYNVPGFGNMTELLLNVSISLPLAVIAFKFLLIITKNLEIAKENAKQQKKERIRQFEERMLQGVKNSEITNPAEVTLILSYFEYKNKSMEKYTDLLERHNKVLENYNEEFEKMEEHIQNNPDILDDYEERINELDNELILSYKEMVEAEYADADMRAESKAELEEHQEMLREVNEKKLFPFNIAFFAVILLYLMIILLGMFG